MSDQVAQQYSNEAPLRHEVLILDALLCKTDLSLIERVEVKLALFGGIEAKRPPSLDSASCLFFTEGNEIYEQRRTG